MGRAGNYTAGHRNADRVAPNVGDTARHIGLDLLLGVAQGTIVDHDLLGNLVLRVILTQRKALAERRVADIDRKAADPEVLFQAAVQVAPVFHNKVDVGIHAHRDGMDAIGPGVDGRSQFDRLLGALAGALVHDHSGNIQVIAGDLPREKTVARFRNYKSIKHSLPPLIYSAAGRAVEVYVLNAPPVMSTAVKP